MSDEPRTGRDDPRPDRRDGQPLPESVRPGVPDPAWSREDLYARADWEVKKLRREKYYAPNYWWLGKVLQVVRSTFEDEGEWTA